MSEAVIVALISGLCVGVPSIITCIMNNKTTRENNQKENDLTRYQIQELKKQVEKHNGVIERVYVLEKENAIQNEQIQEIKNKVG